MGSIEEHDHRRHHKSEHSSRKHHHHSKESQNEKNSDNKQKSRDSPNGRHPHNDFHMVRRPSILKCLVSDMLSDDRLKWGGSKRRQSVSRESAIQEENSDDLKRGKQCIVGQVKVDTPTISSIEEDDNTKRRRWRRNSQEEESSKTSRSISSPTRKSIDEKLKDFFKGNSSKREDDAISEVNSSKRRSSRESKNCGGYDCHNKCRKRWKNNTKRLDRIEERSEQETPKSIKDKSKRKDEECVLSSSSSEESLIDHVPGRKIKSRRSRNFLKQDHIAQMVAIANPDVCPLLNKIAKEIVQFQSNIMNEKDAKDLKNMKNKSKNDMRNELQRSNSFLRVKQSLMEFAQKSNSIMLKPVAPKTMIKRTFTKQELGDLHIPEYKPKIADHKVTPEENNETFHETNMLLYDARIPFAYYKPFEWRDPYHFMEDMSYLSAWKYPIIYAPQLDQRQSLASSLVANAATTSLKPCTSCTSCEMTECLHKGTFFQQADHDYSIDSVQMIMEAATDDSFRNDSSIATTGGESLHVFPERRKLRDHFRMDNVMMDSCRNGIKTSQGRYCYLSFDNPRASLGIKRKADSSLSFIDSTSKKNCILKAKSRLFPGAKVFQNVGLESDLIRIGSAKHFAAKKEKCAKTFDQPRQVVMKKSRIPLLQKNYQRGKYNSDKVRDDILKRRISNSKDVRNLDDEALELVTYTANFSSQIVSGAKTNKSKIIPKSRLPVRIKTQSKIESSERSYRFPIEIDVTGASSKKNDNGKAAQVSISKTSQATNHFGDFRQDIKEVQSSNIVRQLQFEDSKPHNSDDLSSSSSINSLNTLYNISTITNYVASIRNDSIQLNDLVNAADYHQEQEDMSGMNIVELFEEESVKIHKCASKSSMFVSTETQTTSSLFNTITSSENNSSHFYGLEDLFHKLLSNHNDNTAFNEITNKDVSLEKSLHQDLLGCGDMCCDKRNQSLIKICSNEDDQFSIKVYNWTTCSDEILLTKFERNRLQKWEYNFGNEFASLDQNVVLVASPNELETWWSIHCLSLGQCDKLICFIQQVYQQINQHYQICYKSTNGLSRLYTILQSDVNPMSTSYMVYQSSSERPSGQSTIDSSLRDSKLVNTPLIHDSSLDISYYLLRSKLRMHKDNEPDMRALAPCIYGKQQKAPTVGTKGDGEEPKLEHVPSFECPDYGKQPRFADVERLLDELAEKQIEEVSSEEELSPERKEMLHELLEKADYQYDMFAPEETESEGDESKAIKSDETEQPDEAESGETQPEKEESDETEPHEKESEETQPEEKKFGKIEAREPRRAEFEEPKKVKGAKTTTPKGEKSERVRPVLGQASSESIVKNAESEEPEQSKKAIKEQILTEPEGAPKKAGQVTIIPGRVKKTPVRMVKKEARDSIMEQAEEPVIGEGSKPDKEPTRVAGSKQAPKQSVEITDVPIIIRPDAKPGESTGPSYRTSGATVEAAHPPGVSSKKSLPKREAPKGIVGPKKLKKQSIQITDESEISTPSSGKPKKTKQAAEKRFEKPRDSADESTEDGILPGHHIEEKPSKKKQKEQVPPRYRSTPKQAAKKRLKKPGDSADESIEEALLPGPHIEGRPSKKRQKRQVPPRYREMSTEYEDIMEQLQRKEISQMSPKEKSTQTTLCDIGGHIRDTLGHAVLSRFFKIAVPLCTCDERRKFLNANPRDIVQAGHESCGFTQHFRMAKYECCGDELIVSFGDSIEVVFSSPEQGEDVAKADSGQFKFCEEGNKEACIRQLEGNAAIGSNWRSRSLYPPLIKLYDKFTTNDCFICRIKQVLSQMDAEYTTDDAFAQDIMACLVSPPTQSCPAVRCFKMDATKVLQVEHKYRSLFAAKQDGHHADEATNTELFAGLGGTTGVLQELLWKRRKRLRRIVGLNPGCIDSKCYGNYKRFGKPKRYKSTRDDTSTSSKLRPNRYFDQSRINKWRREMIIHQGRSLNDTNDVLLSNERLLKLRKRKLVRRRLIDSRPKQCSNHCLSKVNIQTPMVLHHKSTKKENRLCHCDTETQTICTKPKDCARWTQTPRVKPALCISKEDINSGPADYMQRKNHSESNREKRNSYELEHDKELQSMKLKDTSRTKLNDLKCPCKNRGSQVRKRPNNKDVHGEHLNKNKGTQAKRHHKIMNDYEDHKNQFHNKGIQVERKHAHNTIRQRKHKRIPEDDEAYGNMKTDETVVQRLWHRLSRKFSVSDSSNLKGASTNHFQSKDRLGSASSDDLRRSSRLRSFLRRSSGFGKEYFVTSEHCFYRHPPVVFVLVKRWIKFGQTSDDNDMNKFETHVLYERGNKREVKSKVSMTDLSDHSEFLWKTKAKRERTMDRFRTKHGRRFVQTLEAISEISDTEIDRVDKSTSLENVLEPQKALQTYLNCRRANKVTVVVLKQRTKKRNRCGVISSKIVKPGSTKQRKRTHHISIESSSEELIQTIINYDTKELETQTVFTAQLGQHEDTLDVDSGKIKDVPPIEESKITLNDYFVADYVPKKQNGTKTTTPIELMEYLTNTKEMLYFYQHDTNFAKECVVAPLKVIYINDVLCSSTSSEDCASTTDEKLPQLWALKSATRETNFSRMLKQIKSSRFRVDKEDYGNKRSKKTVLEDGRGQCSRYLHKYNNQRRRSSSPTLSYHMEVDSNRTETVSSSDGEKQSEVEGKHQEEKKKRKTASTSESSDKPNLKQYFEKVRQKRQERMERRIKNKIDKEERKISHLKKRSRKSETPTDESSPNERTKPRRWCAKSTSDSDSSPDKKKKLRLSCKRRQASSSKSSSYSQRFRERAKRRRKRRQERRRSRHSSSGGYDDTTSSTKGLCGRRRIIKQRRKLKRRDNYVKDKRYKKQSCIAKMKKRREIKKDLQSDYEEKDMKIRPIRYSLQESTNNFDSDIPRRKLNVIKLTDTGEDPERNKDAAKKYLAVLGKNGIKMAAKKEAEAKKAIAKKEAEAKKAAAKDKAKAASSRHESTTSLSDKRGVEKRVSYGNVEYSAKKSAKNIKVPMQYKLPAKRSRLSECLRTFFTCGFRKNQAPCGMPETKCRCKEICAKMSANMYRRESILKSSAIAMHVKEQKSPMDTTNEFSRPRLNDRLGEKRQRKVPFKEALRIYNESKAKDLVRNKGSLVQNSKISVDASNDTSTSNAECKQTKSRLRLMNSLRRGYRHDRNYLGSLHWLKKTFQSLRRIKISIRRRRECPSTDISKLRNILEETQDPKKPDNSDLESVITQSEPSNNDPIIKPIDVYELMTNHRDMSPSSSTVKNQNIIDKLKTQLMLKKHKVCSSSFQKNRSSIEFVLSLSRNEVDQPMDIKIRVNSNEKTPEIVTSSSEVETNVTDLGQDHVLAGPKYNMLGLEDKVLVRTLEESQNHKVNARNVGDEGNLNDSYMRAVIKYLLNIMDKESNACSRVGTQLSAIEEESCDKEKASNRSVGIEVNFSNELRDSGQSCDLRRVTFSRKHGRIRKDFKDSILKKSTAQNFTQYNYGMSNSVNSGTTRDYCATHTEIVNYHGIRAKSNKEPQLKITNMRSCIRSRRLQDSDDAQPKWSILYCHGNRRRTEERRENVICFPMTSNYDGRSNFVQEKKLTWSTTKRQKDECNSRRLAGGGGLYFGLNHENDGYNSIEDLNVLIEIDMQDLIVEKFLLFPHLL